MASTDPLLVLWNDDMRAKAIAWIKAAPKDSRVIFKSPKRTLPQNARLHAMLTDVATQKTHAGLKLSVTDWKRLFSAGLKRELRLIPNLDGDGVVQVGDRTSEMSIAEMAELITFIEAWGVMNGVVFSEPEDSRRAAA